MTFAFVGFLANTNFTLPVNWNNAGNNSWLLLGPGANGSGLSGGYGGTTCMWNNVTNFAQGNTVVIKVGTPGQNTSVTQGANSMTVTASTTTAFGVVVNSASLNFFNFYFVEGGTSLTASGSSPGGSGGGGAGGIEIAGMEAANGTGFSSGGYNGGAGGPSGAWGAGGPAGTYNIGSDLGGTNPGATSSQNGGNGTDFNAVIAAFGGFGAGGSGGSSVFTPATGVGGAAGLYGAGGGGGPIAGGAGSQGFVIVMYEPNAPTLTSLGTTTGSVGGGTSVTLTGTNFAFVSAVNFGANAATGVVVNSGTSITCVSPAGGAPGSVNVTVVTNGGTTGTKPFTYTGPTLTGVNPTTGSVGGGTSVTVTGTNFVAGQTTVAFGANPGTSVSVSNGTSLTVTSPAGAAGTVNVVATISGTATANSGADDFTYEIPTVSAVSPDYGVIAGGTAVTVTGTFFISGATVHFGANVATSIAFVNSTTMTCDAPAAAGAGSVDVTVLVTSNSSTTSSSDKFFYEVAPTISSLTPNTASVGASIVITGTNLLSTTGIKFGTNAASTFAASNDTSLTVTVPSGSGNVFVVLTNIAGTTTNSASDTFAYKPSSGSAQFLVFGL